MSLLREYIREMLTEKMEGWNYLSPPRDFKDKTGIDMIHDYRLPPEYTSPEALQDYIEGNEPKDSQEATQFYSSIVDNLVELNPELAPIVGTGAPDESGLLPDQQLSDVYPWHLKDIVMGVASEFPPADIKHYLGGPAPSSKDEETIQALTDQTGTRPQWVISPETAAKHLDLQERRIHSYIRSYIRELVEATGDGPVRQSFDIPIPKDLQDIHSRMKYAGRELYLVGGAVRDALMGKSPKDYDVATNASPEEVIKILQKDSKLKLDLTGKSFGVVRVKTPADGEYEIATFREDIGKGKGTSVKFSTIENDVRRRDLTINALFYDMDSGEVVDYVGGIKDIEDGVIRAVGEPGQRFDEDRIRILRAVRFAGRMGSNLDPATKQAILEDNALIDTETGAPIPGDRITEEFIKGIKSAQDVGHFLSLVQELKLFDQILPGLEVDLSEFGSQDHLAQIAAVLRNNPPDLVVPSLQRMRYSNNETKTISFLLRFRDLNRETAAKLKKDFNRLNLNPDHLENFAEITGTPSEAKVRGFLEFAAAPLAGDPKELMAKGLKGPEIGLAMHQAEAEAYSDFIGEVRKYIRKTLCEASSFEWTPEMKDQWSQMMDDEKRNVERNHGVGGMNPDVVYDQLNQPMQASMYDGETYLDFAFDAIDHENWPAAVNAILEALWIDDIPVAADEALEVLLMDVQNEDDLAGAIVEWVPRYWKVNAQGRIMGRK